MAEDNGALPSPEGSGVVNCEALGSQGDGRRTRSLVEVDEDIAEQESIDFTQSENPYLEFLRAAVGQETLDEAVAASGDYTDAASEGKRQRMHEDMVAREAAALEAELAAAAAREEDGARTRVPTPAVPLHARPPLPPGAHMRPLAAEAERRGSCADGPALESAAMWLEPRRGGDAWEWQSGSSYGAFSNRVRLHAWAAACFNFL